MHGRPLFGTYDMYGLTNKRKEQAVEGVCSLPENTLLGAPESDLVDALVDQFRLDVPVICEERIHVETTETEVDVAGDFRYGAFGDGPCSVPGQQTTFTFPFEGDKNFLDVVPQMRHSLPHDLSVTDGAIVLTCVQPGTDSTFLKQQYRATVNALRGNLKSLADSAAQFNAELPPLIRGEIGKRMKRLLDAANMTADLGLPIKRRADAPATYAVPVQRKKPRVEIPQVTAAFKPEPALSMTVYEDILGIMRNMVHVMELSPKAFQHMGEEDLRWHFLVQLNAQFEGGATGETFNFQGKTDILIRFEQRNVFIAECKFWNGEKQLLATIDQLLSYLSWRDTKAAVLVFSRNVGFSAVLEKISATIPIHPCFKKSVGRKDETTFAFIFRQPNDPNREVLVTVMAFDVPAPTAA
jgi:hypothetical protein